MRCADVADEEDSIVKTTPSDLRVGSPSQELGVRSDDEVGRSVRTEIESNHRRRSTFECMFGPQSVAVIGATDAS